MIEVPTVAVQDLAEPATIATALSDWRGFVEVAPVEQPEPAPPVLLMNEAHNGAWHSAHFRMPLSVGPLGCRFLRDVEVCGSGYPFHAGRFIREFAHTSDVGLQWLQREDFPDNPFVTQPANTVVVDAPGLLVAGPGFPIWGHWLLDFLPRVAIARHLLGADIAEFVLPLPIDAPDWVARMLSFFCGIGEDRIIRYDRMTDRLTFRRACLPSFAHNGDYVLHSFALAFYAAFMPREMPLPTRRLCISRSRFEVETRSLWRVFEGRATLEALATAHGYEIVRPEELGFGEQIALFASASHVLGEHGSGMHTALFSRPGTVIGCVGFSNPVQLLIGAARKHRNLFMARLEKRTDERGVIFYAASEEHLASLIDQMAGLPAV